MDVPPDLISLQRWITWREEDDTKKPNCKWSDPNQWVSFDDVKGFDKIGFVLVDSDGFCGVDLDDVIGPGGDWTDEAIEVMDRFKGVAYAEISPSGTGVKLWTRGRKIAGSKCDHSTWLECYDRGRWFAVTGKQVPGYGTIGDGQNAIDWLCNKYLKPEPKKVPAYQPVAVASKSLSERAQAYVEAADRPMEGGRNNAAFRLSGHLFSLVQPDGERLGIEDVKMLVRQWNFTLPVPMEDDEIQSVVESASKNGTPREDKEASVVQVYPEVDISKIVNQAWSTPAQEHADQDSDSDEEFCRAMVPESGLLREIYDFYWELAYRPSSVMGLAVAVSLCETIYGRRIRSYSDMRTNDYNLILAPTGSGKEACESTVTKILLAADPSGTHQIPPDVQSGNGLVKAVCVNPCGIWVCDEFGKILQAVLDKKGNHYIKTIGTHLLKMYGKSNGVYGGSAYADGPRNRIIQPHLVILGLSTGCTVFGSVSSDQVNDGLLSRISFWPVQDRPEPKQHVGIVEPKAEMVQRVKDWIEFAPGGNLGSEFPVPEVVRWSEDAFVRHKTHESDIDTRMRSESESRAAIWSRVAARSMKLALVHRASRLEVSPKTCQWDFVQVEMRDENWGIKLSNWLARTSCDLVRENTVDTGLAKAKAILVAATANGPVNASDLLRAHRGITAGDFKAAADVLGYVTVGKKGKGRPKVFYERPMN